MHIHNTIIIEFGLGITVITFTKLESLRDPEEPAILGIVLERYTTPQEIGSEVSGIGDAEIDKTTPAIILAIHNIEGAMVLKETLELVITQLASTEKH